MNTFELNDLILKQQISSKPYLEFLRVPTLSMGLYSLSASGTDMQLPHSEDEVYYVASGKAQITVAGETRPVQDGSIIFVAANAPHNFHSIEQNLSILVFFAPAEYTNKL